MGPCADPGDTQAKRRPKHEWTVTYRDGDGESSLVTATPANYSPEQGRPRRVIVEDEDGDQPKLVYEILWAPGPALRARDGATKGAVLFFLYGTSPTVAYGFKAVACTPTSAVIGSDSLSGFVPVSCLAQGETYHCTSLGSALSALYRCHTLCSVDLLHPSLSQAVLRSSKHASHEPGPWVPKQHARPGIAKLNSSQQRALDGIVGPVVCVQGPPGTGTELNVQQAV